MTEKKKLDKQWNKQMIDSAFTWSINVMGTGICLYTITIHETSKSSRKEYSITKEEYNQLDRYLHTGIWVKN